MSDRVSEMVLLCEDSPQETLVRLYMKACGLDTERSLRLRRGGGASWVLREFGQELEACRRRSRRAKTLLIVVIDADNHTLTERRGHLNGRNQILATDPIVVLIPKRHVETWIRSGQGQTVNERDDYKRPQVERPDIREAANTIYAWARGNPTPPDSCVPSLKECLPEWHTIG